MRPMRVPGRLVLRVLIAAVVLSVTVAGTAARAVTPPKVDWPTFGFDVERSGFNPHETVLSTANAGHLHELWNFQTGSFIEDQPVLAANVRIGSRLFDIVNVGAENGMFFAVNAGSGRRLWRRFLGREPDLQCGQGPTFGVSGSAAIDRANGVLYVVGGNDKAYALDLATGETRPGWPVRLSDDLAHEHVYSAVTLFRGSLYVSVASQCEKPPYFGRVMRIATGDPTTPPRILHTWYVTGSDRTVSGGGVWGPGGVSIDPSSGDVFAATGNALTDPESYRYADHVVRLTHALFVESANDPGIGGDDRDFGATPLLYRPPGCPPQLLVKNKNGKLYRYLQGRIGHGPAQEIHMAQAVSTFQGIPAYSPATNMVYVGNSSDHRNSADHVLYRHGVVAFRVKPDCGLAVAWQQEVGPANGVVPSPTVANGVVYYGDASGDRVFAFDAETGRRLWNSGDAIGGAVYAAPMVVNGQLYVGSFDGNLYAFGL